MGSEAKIRNYDQASLVRLSFGSAAVMRTFKTLIFRRRALSIFAELVGILEFIACLAYKRISNYTYSKIVGEDGQILNAFSSN